MKIFTKAAAVFVIAFVCTLGSTGVAFAATAVDLGTAGSFGVLSGSTITNTGPTVINGDVGLSPGTSVTGFPPGIVNGSEHITDAVAAQAEADAATAYNAASGQSSGVITISGDIGGQVLTPGLYKSTSSVGLTGTVTLDGQGNPDSVFVFQIGSALTTASASRVALINGAQACNIFWQVGSSATLGTNSSFAGTILALSSITVTSGTTVSGRVLARNGAVTLDTSPITKPTCTAPTVLPIVATTTVVLAPVLIVASTTTPIIVVTSTTTPPQAVLVITSTTTPPQVAQVITPATLPAAVPFVSLQSLPATGRSLIDELWADMLYLILPSVLVAFLGIFSLSFYLSGRRE